MSEQFWLWKIKRNVFPKTDSIIYSKNWCAHREWRFHYDSVEGSSQSQVNFDVWFAIIISVWQNLNDCLFLIFHSEFSQPFHSFEISQSISAWLLRMEGHWFDRVGPDITHCNKLVWAIVCLY